MACHITTHTTANTVSSILPAGQGGQEATVHSKLSPCDAVLARGGY
jgi:hypothetical protein